MSWETVGLSDAGKHLDTMQRLTARLYQVYTATAKDAIEQRLMGTPPHCRSASVQTEPPRR
jgi:hypothetical protein